MMSFAQKGKTKKGFAVRNAKILLDFPLCLMHTTYVKLRCALYNEFSIAVSRSASKHPGYPRKPLNGKQ